MENPQPPARRFNALARSRPAWLAAALVAAAAGGGAWWWQQREGTGDVTGAPLAGASAPASAASGAGGRRFGGANRVQPVTVAKVRRQDVRVIHAAIGNIAALNTAVVRARVEGELRAIRFKEGQQVKAGQLLAEIDPRAFEVQLAQAQGQLARDQAQLRNAQIDFERYKDLASRDSIARQQLDTQEALVRQLQGTLQVNQAAVDSARLMLSYTKVTAPISGRLGLKLADLGNVVRSGDAAGIVTITQTQPISVVFAVPEALLPRVNARMRAGDELVVEAWDRDQRTRLAVGKISTTDNAIDPVTGTIKLKAEFTNEQGSLFPNQFVNIRLQIETQEAVLAVPVTALQRGARGSFVYLVKEDGTVTVRPVRPGAVDGDWMGVQAELAVGDRVVTDGADRLREGAKVEVITPPQRGPGAGPGAGGGAPADGMGPRSRPAGAASAASAASAPRSKGEGRRPDPAAADAPAPDRPRGPGRGPGAAGASGQGSAGGAAGQGSAEAPQGRPPWLDRLPPDVQERFMKMNPEERKAFVERMREMRRKREAEGGGG